ncbi:hypothetical protein D3C74_313250 [compost metagenome]
MIGFSYNHIILHMKNSFGCAVNQDNRSFAVHHQDAPGHIRQNALHQILIIMNLLQLLLKTVCHSINSLPKLADLIITIQVNSCIIIKTRNPVGYECNMLKRLGQSSSHPIAYQCCSNKQYQQASSHQHPALGKLLAYSLKAHRQSDVSVKAVFRFYLMRDIEHLLADAIAISYRTANSSIRCRNDLFAERMIVHAIRRHLRIPNYSAIQQNKGDS